MIMVRLSLFWGPPSLLCSELRVFFLGVKRLGCEANPSHLSSAKIKNAWSYISTTPIRLHIVVFN